jgi:hypothetical protein
MNFEFEWDHRKAAANLLKHGVSFEVACDAFKDPFAMEWEDVRHDDAEPRFILLAEVRGRILVVVYTWRGEIVRLISARLAEPFERRLCFEEAEP